MQKVNVHSTKKPSISTFCEGCKELQQKVDGLEQKVDGLQQDNAELKQDNAELKQDNAELNQKVDGLQQSNAELWTAVNSLVVPMQKVHRRVLLHCLREKIYQLLVGKPIVSSNINWYDFLHGIRNSPEQLRTLNMSADIILIITNKKKVATYRKLLTTVVQHSLHTFIHT